MASSRGSSGDLRPDPASPAGVTFVFGEYTLDPRAKRLVRGNAVVPLTTKAFDTLEVLIRAAGQTVSKEDLLKQVWPGTFVQEDTLAQNISTIRRALGETADSPRHVLTVPRDGYRFLAPVEIACGGPASAESVPRQQQPTVTLSGTERRPVRFRRWFVAVMLGATSGAVLAALAITWLRHTVSPLSIALEVFEPDGARFSTSGGILALSPDGRHLAFIAEGSDRQDYLWIRASASLESTPLSGTQDASQPFWSTDGQSIAFFSRGALRRIDVSGTEVRTVCPLASNANALAGSWSSRNLILFSVQGKGLFKVRASGGDATRVELTGLQDCSACLWPTFLPDGQHFLFTVAAGQANRGIYLGSLDGGAPRRLLDDVSSTAYTTDGYLVYASAGALVARRFDAVRGQAGADVVPIADHVWFNPITTRAVFSASNTDLIAYREPLTTRLRWISRTGNVISVGPEGIFHNFAISRTGRVLVSRLDPQIGTYDLWLYDADWKTAIRLTFDPASDLNPFWSADGRKAVFARDVGPDGWQLYEVSLDRPGVERPLLTPPTTDIVAPILWEDDLLYYAAVRPGERARIWAIRTEGAESPTLASFVEGGGAVQTRVAPNGRWLAYTVNVTDSRVPRAALFVRPWPSGQGQLQIVAEGSVPRWRSDSGELFFIAGDGHLMSVPVENGRTIGPPVPLWATEALAASGVAGDPYDVAVDGQRFLVKVPARRPSIVVMSGWLSTAIH